MRIAFFVPGNPKALKRHRTYKGKNMKFPVETDPSVGDKQDFLAKCMEHRPKSPFLKPLSLNCIFDFKRPKNHYNSKGFLKPNTTVWKTSRPDIDNLVKFILDALNGIFWNDDTQVVLLSATKSYITTGAPGVYIVVTEIDEIEKIMNEDKEK
jgi:Holliday junction resolvase RusA-like endonuclease